MLSNVLALSMGGIWALWLTGTHFSISAAVGFVSLFGVAIMDGLLMISYFNQHRAPRACRCEEAIMQGAEKRVRPVMMTALTAIFGLLPAALALRPAWDADGRFRWVEQIGSQTQRPLAIVVVGGMITTLLLTRYLMPVLYSFYGHREPPADGGRNRALKVAGDTQCAVADSVGWALSIGESHHRKRSWWGSPTLGPPYRCYGIRRP